jgi:hypothetical protein
MKHLALFVFLLLGSLATATSEEEYLLRVDSIRSIEQPAGDKGPQEENLRRIELIARPGQPFHAKIQIDKETLTLTGKLEPSEHGGFTVQFRFDDVIDTGNTVVPEINQVQPTTRHTTRVNTNVGVTVGTPAALGELHAIKTEPGKPPRKTSVRHILNLTKYEPSVK